MAAVSAPLDVEALLRRGGFRFDRSFDVSPVAHADGTPFTKERPPTRFRGAMSSGWIGGNGRLIGSYVYCFALRCMLAYTAPLGYPDPVSLHTDFYASAPAGAEVEVVLKERKRGKSYVFVDAELLVLPPKDGKELVSATLSKKPLKAAGPVPIVGCHGVFGNLLPEGEGRQVVTTRYKAPSVIPPFDQCVDPYRLLAYSRPDTIHRQPSDTAINVRDTVVQRSDPAALIKAFKKAEAEIKGGSATSVLDYGEAEQWVSMSDSRPNDALSIAYYCDMLPPNYVLQERLERARYGVRKLPTTISLSIHFYSLPKTVLLRRSVVASLFSAGRGGAGLSDFEICLWDESGEHVVALARQTVHLLEIPDRKAGSKAKL
ncbi:thioesterase-like superfamily-domain-containing protein [Hyaloraphidium curvatum]|nr:thioesterase-like superfamily-domain-containing protein [Hyaloraphidium curvatum]